MRICLISREFPPDSGWGGIATFVHNLAVGLVEIGQQVEVVSLACGDEDRTEECSGVIVHRVSWRNELEAHQRFLTAMPYSHNILKQTSSLWRKYAQLNNQSPFDVVETPEMFGESIFPALSRRTALVVRLYTPHFKFIAQRLNNVGNSFDHQFLAMLERMTILSADLLTSPSDDLAQFVSEDVNYPRQSIQIIRNPLDVARFCPAGAKFTNSDRRPTILFVGRLEERKGIRYLIDAIPQVVAAIPQAKFVILGNDTAYAGKGSSVLAELKKSLERRNCTKHVQFIDRVPLEELPDYYRSADICVVPSLYDNSPYTCLEAMSCGKPVIGTSAGGIKEYVLDSKTGLIIPPADTNALAEAIIALLKDESRRQRFGEAARQHVLTNFNRLEIARQSVELYEQARSNFRSARHSALYRHPEESLLPATEELLWSYEKMLYDLLYVHSWRFRLKHWSSMIKNRPRLTAAKAVVKLSRLFSRATGMSLPSSVHELESKLETQR